MHCQTNSLLPCAVQISLKPYPGGTVFVVECHVTIPNQGLFSTTMEAEKRDPGNEVAIFLGIHSIERQNTVTWPLKLHVILRETQRGFG